MHDTPTIFADRAAAIAAMREYLSPISGGADGYDLDRFVDATLSPNPDGDGFIFADEELFATTLDACEYTAAD